jgi:hypothetical protein
MVFERILNSHCVDGRCRSLTGVAGDDAIALRRQCMICHAMQQ